MGSQSQTQLSDWTELILCEGNWSLRQYKPSVDFFNLSSVTEIFNCPELSYWFIVISRFLGECPMILLRIRKNLNMCFWISWIYLKHESVQFSCSVVSDCDPMDCSTPGFPVHHQLPELAQTHVHRVTDAIQPSHPLLSTFPPAFNLKNWWRTDAIKWPKSLDD